MSFVKWVVFTSYRINSQSEHERLNQVKKNNLNFDLKTISKMEVKQNDTAVWTM